MLHVELKPDFSLWDPQPSFFVSRWCRTCFRRGCTMCSSRIRRQPNPRARLMMQSSTMPGFTAGLEPWLKPGCWSPGWNAVRLLNQEAVVNFHFAALNPSACVSLKVVQLLSSLAAILATVSYACVRYDCSVSMISPVWSSLFVSWFLL